MNGHWLLALVLAGCGVFGSGTDESNGHEEHEEHEEHDERDGDVVELAAEAITSGRIVVDEATEGTLRKTISLPARVTLDPRREALVSAWIEGQVDRITVRGGDTVRSGQELARVQSPELGGAVAAFRTAKARDDAADARLERLRRLEADGVSSRAQVLEAEAHHAGAEGALEAAEERLRILGVPMDVGDPHAGEHFPSRVPVTTPIAGIVLEADVSVGERVEPGQALFRVGDLEEVWLLVDVYERHLSVVHEGQAVRFSVEAWPGRWFEGVVTQVGDWVEPNARTIEVRVVVANPDLALKPNMFATALLSLQRPDGRRGIVLPSQAVQTVDGADVVFVEQSPGHFAVRQVTVMEASSNEVQLDAGLAVGERVVIDGAFALKGELEKGELGEGHAH